ncbi:GNAT family N-acetyltransferase [Formosa sp. A9]|uniref:GNAT family N-acetyltransferase n=1 Tax=Formosa sp. A9 TaxID=3442641 RepID=UPI003EBB8E77
MNTNTLKKATLNDIEILQFIGRKTFYETFITGNTEDDMKKYLDERFSTEKLTNELNEKDSEFYVAFDNETVIGYLKTNTGKAQTEAQNENALEVERIYVAKEYHGKKVGQLFYDKALEIAISINAPYLWLGVWEENPRAINFYKKNGFEEFDKHIFKLGNDEQTDIMMKKNLSFQ